MAYDLLIKGGTNFDPSQVLNAGRDVALSGNRAQRVICVYGSVWHA